jgi:hypothetical protein
MIRADNRQSMTIKHGTIRGFFFGILLANSGASQGHIVEDIRADQSTFIGIQVDGSGTLVRNNHVVATGGTTVFPRRRRGTPVPHPAVPMAEGDGALPASDRVKPRRMGRTQAVPSAPSP